MKSPEDVMYGEIYDVPCVKINNIVYPVMLPSHRDGNDNCLMDAGQHYHVDFRFIDIKSKFNAISASLSSELFISRLPALRKFCESIGAIGEVAFHFVNRWHRLEADSFIKKERICPHQGTRITNACGTCPAHGLIWNLKTGKLKYKPPFYLQLIDKNGIAGPKAIIDEYDQCKVVMNTEFKFSGQVIMIDSENEKYGHWVQTLDSKNFNVGEILIFDVDKLCSKEAS